MSHLSYEQRYTIEVLLNDGQAQNKIAQVLSVDKSVISLEIKRNRDGRNSVYKAKLAQSKYENRRQLKPKQVKFSDELRAVVVTLLKQDLSPEQIAGVLKNKETTFFVKAI